MDRFGTLRVLGVSGLLEVFSFIDIRVVLRCQRLSTFFKTFVAENLKRIRPRKISDTEITLRFPGSKSGELILSPGPKELCKYQLNYLLDSPEGRIDDDRIAYWNLEDYTVVPKGRVHFLNTKLNSETHQSFVSRLLEGIASAFEFDSFTILENPNSLVFYFNASQIRFFPEIQHLYLRGAYIVSPYFENALLQLSNLETFRTTKNACALEGKFLTSNTAQHLKVLDIRVNGGDARAFDDSMLNGLTNLEELRLQSNYHRFLHGGLAVTSITLKGIHELQRQWKCGMRPKLQRLEFAIERPAGSNARDVLHNHACERCGLIREVTDNDESLDHWTEGHFLLSATQTPLLFMIGCTNEDNFDIKITRLNATKFAWNNEELKEWIKSALE